MESKNYLALNSLPTDPLKTKKKINTVLTHKRIVLYYHTCLMIFFSSEEYTKIVDLLFPPA